jgi:hypothetical protein
VAGELESLPEAVLGPAALYRVIAACQKTFPDAGIVAVGPLPKYSKQRC